MAATLCLSRALPSQANFTALCLPLKSTSVWPSSSLLHARFETTAAAENVTANSVAPVSGEKHSYQTEVFSRLRTLESNLFKMVPSAVSCASLSGQSVRHGLDGYSRLGAMRLPQDATLHGGMRRSLNIVHGKGIAFCTIPNSDGSSSQDNQGAPQQQQQPSVRTFEDYDSDRYQMSSTVRRRPYNLEAKMRMKTYRREAMMQKRQQELEEEQKNFQLDYTSIYQKGAPGTVQGVIREIINLGYFITLPNGREGLLAASHLGCSGGIPLLERLFKVGQEITVRVIPVPNPAGRDRCYVRP